MSLLAIILGSTWVVDALADVRGIWRHVPTLLVLTVVVAHNIRTGDWGLSARAFSGALKWTAILTTPIVFALWLIGRATGSAPERPHPWLDFLYLIFWGGGQQLALQTVVLSEARELVGRAGFLLAAILFAVLHLPNPFLTTVTAIGGVAWCWIYSKHPNVVPLALSHAIATVVILMSFDSTITGGLRTGWAFFK